jgi:hypothetical protein|tara:strand:- start:17742 stop:17990 length:249 start_codon:yes stop_codon:yes gene_type:complete
MISKIVVMLINNLLGKATVFFVEYFKKRKIAKLENQVRSYEDKVLILKREKETQLKIENWKDRLRNKENESLAKELNRILNG